MHIVKMDCRNKSGKMKYFEIIANVKGRSSFEDPRCPSQWRGSGCYDVTCHGHQLVEFQINAMSAALAIQGAEEYCYEHCEFEIVHDVEIKSVIITGEDTEDGDVEVMSFSPGEIWWEDRAGCPEYY